MRRARGRPRRGHMETRRRRDKVRGSRQHAHAHTTPESVAAGAPHERTKDEAWSRARDTPGRHTHWAACRHGHARLTEDCRTQDRASTAPRPAPPGRARQPPVRHMRTHTRPQSQSARHAGRTRGRAPTCGAQSPKSSTPRRRQDGGGAAGGLGALTQNTTQTPLRQK